MKREVEIARLGAQGDGVAEGAGGPLYVPFALPGETVRIAVTQGSDRAELLDVLRPSPDRIAPACPHFGVCGGCALQHLERAAYLDWKREKVAGALRARGLDAEVEQVKPVPVGSRRRAALALARGKTGAALGYRRARSHELIDIAVCPVLSPGIVARLPGLKATLGRFVSGRREARVGITETPSGLDVVLEGARATEAALAAFAGQASALGVARLTCDGESIGPVAAPEIELSGVRVKLPAGAFLQASGEAETVMADLVREGVGDARRIADLFAGLGTLTFALARAAAVDAFEADEAALRALAEAFRKTQGLKPVRTFTRDLFRAPLGVSELRAYEAAVFDPPRAGAASQAAKLAESEIPRLVAVSCDPGTLARDLRILVDGGYRIARIVPVDQFLFSPHVEVVAHLER
ncbi:MAG: class I SAM-dependent RNA methyltransferase [Methyloceanibacter sp.]